MRRARGQGGETRDKIEEDGGDANKPNKPQKCYCRDVEDAADFGRKEKKNLDMKNVLV